MRDPRYADSERFIGLLTAAVGFGSLVPWPSKLLIELQRFGLEYAWDAMFLIVGLGMYAASYLHDVRLRRSLAVVAGIVWAVFIWAALALQMPVLLVSSAVMVWQCARVERALRGGGHG